MDPDPDPGSALKTMDPDPDPGSALKTMVPDPDPESALKTMDPDPDPGHGHSYKIYCFLLTKEEFKIISFFRLYIYAKT